MTPTGRSTAREEGRCGKGLVEGDGEEVERHPRKLLRRVEWSGHVVHDVSSWNLWCGGCL